MAPFIGIMVTARNMANEQNNPFKKFKKAGAAKLSGEAVNALMKRKAAKRKSVKDTGSYEGKSNKLGQGGRAAQLKAQGVPGGVIGNLARAAHAAPGQKNFHKKHKKAKKGVIGMAGDVEMKGAKHKHMKRKSTIGMEGDVEMKKAKHQKKHKHSEVAIKGLEKFAKEESKEKKSKKHKHAQKGAVCMKCKKAHEEHEGKE